MEQVASGRRSFITKLATNGNRRACNSRIGLPKAYKQHSVILI